MVFVVMEFELEKFVAPGAIVSQAIEGDLLLFVCGKHYVDKLVTMLICTKDGHRERA